MEDNTIYRTIVESFDNFIKATGGNIDPRGNGNKERKALMRFYEVVSKMPREHALLYMQLVIDEGLTSLDGAINERLSQGTPVYTPGAVVVDAG